MEGTVAVNDRVIEQYLPGSPSSAEMVANISGCLVNSHSIYEVPMPRVPTFVNILGVICKLLVFFLRLYRVAHNLLLTFIKYFGERSTQGR